MLLSMKYLPYLKPLNGMASHRVGSSVVFILKGREVVGRSGPWSYNESRPSTQVTHEPPTRTWPSTPTCTFTRPSRPTQRP